VGIERAHVLADTVAHEFFARVANDVALHKA
jgi:hypothetical protein